MIFDWEQRKLGDLLINLKSGLSRMLSDIDIGIPVIRANNINNGHLNLNHEIKYWYTDDPKGAKISNYLVRKDDILINFINSESKMGTSAIVSIDPSRDTIYTTNILKLRVNDDTSPYFIFNQTFTSKYKNYIKAITKPAVNQASFTTIDFKKYELLVPKIEEQNKIGDFLKRIDDTIALHKRKLDKLTMIKKGFLQQLFFTENNNQPKLRFKGYNERWYLSKLGDHLTEYVKRTDRENQYELLSSTNNGLEVREGRVNGKSNKGYKILNKNTIVLSPQNLWLGNINLNLNHNQGMVSPSYKTFKIKNIDLLFISELIHLPKMRIEYQRSSIQGASIVRRNLDMTLFMQIPFYKPNNNEEESKIGIYFFKLKKYINQQEQLINNLNLLKKIYLQKLFI